MNIGPGAYFTFITIVCAVGTLIVLYLNKLWQSYSSDE